MATANTAYAAQLQLVMTLQPPHSREMMRGGSGLRKDGAALPLSWQEAVNCFSFLWRATPYICILLSKSEMLATEDWLNCTN